MAAGGEIAAAFRAVHERITGFLTALDGQPPREDTWDYTNGSGGGVTRVWENTGFIERGGVNFSAIQGDKLPPSAATPFQIPDGAPFSATGVSLVIHPHNPYVPAIHMNIRFFEAGGRSWFGGGMDLTPYYPTIEEVVSFHRKLRHICLQAGEDYAAYKKQCDEYFFNAHRNEPRGVGGIFFDHLEGGAAAHLAFVTALGMAFPDIYGPLAEANRSKPFTPAQRAFQLYRRSRYVEFNLLYDRGTRFGLQSGGRAESILLSMPAVAHWKYDWRPEPGSPEAELTDFFLKPRDWVNYPD